MSWSTTRIEPELVPSVPNASESDAIELDLFDLLLPLLRSKRQIALGTGIFLLTGLCISLMLKPIFTSVAVIMPPQQQQSAANALMGQLGSLGSLGSASGLGLKNPADMYVGILQSRVIADDLIDRLKLQEVYRTRMRTNARNELRERTEFEAAKDGLIYIRVKDHDAHRAADLANGYVEELHKLNARLAIGEASQRRLFFDHQLAEERTALAAAEDDLKRTQEKTGMVQLSGQSEMMIRNIATARAEIASHEVQLGVMQTFATDQNPDVARLRQEIGSLNAQLAKLQNAQQRLAPGDMEVPFGKVPEVGTEYLRKLREVRYHESLFELLAKQQEAASLDEAKSSPLIQVVDPAEAPEKKSGPSRVLITLGFGFAGLLLFSTWAIVRSVLETIKRMPSQAMRWEALRRSL